MCEEILAKFPTLELILLGGTISRKMCRAILNLDRWEMDALYEDMLLNGAVVGVSNGGFKASDEMLEYLREKRGY